MKWSIKHRLLLMISVLILLSVSLVTLLTYRHYRADLIAQSTESTMLLLEQLSMNLDTYLDELFRVCLSPYYNRQVMAAIESSPKTSAGQLNKQRAIENYLSQVMILPRSDILRAFIFSNGVYASTKTQSVPDLSSYETADWYQAAWKSSETIFMPARTEQSGRTSLEVFSIAKRINSMNDSSHPIGVIRVDANYMGIKAVCDRMSFSDGSALAIIDDNNQQIYFHNTTSTDIMNALLNSDHWQSGESRFMMSAGRDDYLVNTRSLLSTGWKIVDIHAMESLIAAATKARNQAFFWAILCACLSVLISIGVVRLFLNPIFQMTSLMKSVQSGNLTVRAPVNGHDEFSFLAKSFNEMLSRVQSQMEQNNLLTRQVYEARYLEREAQYTALCNQIQPHFLFNALNTIHLLIKTGKSEEAVQGISMLANLLRGLVNANREISIQAEMKIVESYLCLQKMRYRGLDYILPDTTNLNARLIPALTIQPIVENALKHGCMSHQEGAMIRISIESDAEDLRIIIQDNGSGMSEEQSSALHTSLNQSSMDPDDVSRGIGLVNIARRIRLKFGEKYGLTFETAKGKGTTVTIHLPPEEEASHVSSVDCGR